LVEVPDSKVISISVTWGSSAIATIVRIVNANANLELSALKQHAAAAGLTNETTVAIYASTGPWELSGEGDALRLSYDSLGFGTEWEVKGANSGRTLPLCEGAFFVDGAFPRWVVFAKGWDVAKGALVLDLPLVAAVHIATNSACQIAIDSCVGQGSDFEAAVLTCNARSAKLTLSGVAIPRGTKARIAISIPLLKDIPLQLHLVPGCESSKTIEEYFESLLRESGAESNPAIGFAGLVGFNHPNLGLAPEIEVSEDRRGLAVDFVRRRLERRAEDNYLRTAALKVSMALELTSGAQGDQEDPPLGDPDSPRTASSLGANRQISTVFKTDGSFPIGTWVSHVSGLVSGTVIASDEANTTISNKSLKFSAKTRYFFDPSAAPTADASRPTDDADVADSEVSRSLRASKSWDQPIPEHRDRPITSRAELTKRPYSKPRLPIELQIAERAAMAHPHNRADYLKMVFQELRRYIFPLGDFYVKLALRRLRDAVCLTPTEAEAIRIALKKTG
jgi:hypothetical protein